MPINDTLNLPLYYIFLYKKSISYLKIKARLLSLLPIFFYFAMINIMKKDIHPKYYKKTKAKCSCGAVFEIGSTKEETETEICSQCHPFYTGKEKIIETGQVERFRKRLSKKQESKKKKPRIKKKSKKPASVKTTARQGK